MHIKTETSCNASDHEESDALAKEWARNRVDLIFACENQTARAAQAATMQIPALLIHAADPWYKPTHYHPGRAQRQATSEIGSE